MPHPARVLAIADVRRLLACVRDHRHAVRDRVIVLLSFKAGLRACEIAGLDWTMALNADGKIGHQLLVAGSIAKNGKARRLPLHPDLRDALVRLHVACGRPRDGPVVRSERSGAMTARTIVNWFARLYAEVDLSGCSSHCRREARR